MVTGATRQKRQVYLAKLRLSDRHASCRQSLKLNGVNKLVSRTSDMDGSDGPTSAAPSRSPLEESLILNGAVSLRAPPRTSSRTDNRRTLPQGFSYFPPLRISNGKRVLLSSPRTSSVHALAVVLRRVWILQSRNVRWVSYTQGLFAWSEKCSAPKTTEFCGGRNKAKCDHDCKCVGYFYKEKDKKCLVAPLIECEGRRDGGGGVAAMAVEGVSVVMVAVQGVEAAVVSFQRETNLKH
ncbi:hypothetical protein HID58_091829 [Brassica napus]|uniref:Uncharacterized protein n=1 Tax=Brassica napus TaxID=3708 RepID=A0ABQ7X0P0_BRANA|nr:hypothetical protein HID58_091829 [Brassica napus]